MSQGIVFQVETPRILQLLASEIYDSPLALLRENVQNAYDAIRMRFASSGELSPGGRIDVSVANGEIEIRDNGVGMTEATLRDNFWKAGSSGKRSTEARAAGVVGTFGIGAMANFGVATRLVVETHAEGERIVLRSTAERDSLKIAEECITLERVDSDREIGTSVIATLDAQNQIGPEQAWKYLSPYVELLTVPVYLNGNLLSGKDAESLLLAANRRFAHVGVKTLSDALCGATFEVSVDANGLVLVRATSITLGGGAVDGYMTLLQNGGQLMGLRSSFGLAPVPAIGSYQFGGFANLSFLQPTAGREALTRESIDRVVRLVNLAERAASEAIADSSAADTNNAFLQWIIAHNRYELAGGVSVRVFPEDEEVPLGKLGLHIGTRTTHFYTGTDAQVISTFANEGSCLVRVSQGNPRRQVQLAYLQNVLGVAQVPDAAQITRRYTASDLTRQEASVLLRVGAIVRDDYLISNVDVGFADISHGVTVLAERVGTELKLVIAKSSATLPALYEAYESAYDLFVQFMKDYVRVHIYPRIQPFVPSSTRDGVDALRKVLERNRDLYRYEETERGDLEGVLGEYLAGTSSIADLLKGARAMTSSYTVRVSYEQVGTIEAVVPDVVGSPVAQPPSDGGEFVPSPPIVRSDVLSDMKILTTDAQYPQLNNVRMLLGLSDRLMRNEGEFFYSPHTTRVLWGGHRVIYIFTEATGRLSLYYDIELRNPIDQAKSGGGMFRTTTLITKKRIFVPVPDGLVEEFRVAAGPKEFFVRFDTLSSDVI